jgi:hypothetical protein
VNDKEQQSREFGVKLAKALEQRAREAAAEADLDHRYVILGAADHLHSEASFRLDPPIDSARVDAEERSN